MSATQCPRCSQQVSERARLCFSCGHALIGEDVPVCGSGTGDLRSVLPADGVRRVKPGTRACPRCHGTGKQRDSSWLPWNNLASLCVVVGLAGMISSACLEWSTREIFLGGLVMSMIGFAMYMTGNRCSRCGGSGKVTGEVAERESRRVQIRYGGEG